MLVTYTENAHLKTEPTSFRRFLLICALPILLLLIATPLAQCFTPPAAGQALSRASQVGTSDSLGEKTDTATAQGVREAHRRAALSTMKRLETESRKEGGASQIAIIDLKRLRNALQ